MFGDGGVGNMRRSKAEARGSRKPPASRLRLRPMTPSNPAASRVFLPGEADEVELYDIVS